MTPGAPVLRLEKFPVAAVARDSLKTSTGSPPERNSRNRWDLGQRAGRLAGVSLELVRPDAGAIIVKAQNRKPPSVYNDRCGRRLHSRRPSPRRHCRRDERGGKHGDRALDPSQVQSRGLLRRDAIQSHADELSKEYDVRGPGSRFPRAAVVRRQHPETHPCPGL